MGSIIGEDGHLENGDSLLLKRKRQKVSAVRDFPSGCGPNATASVCKQIKAKGVRGVHEPVMDFDITDADNCAEKGRDIWEADRKGHQEQMVQPGCLNGDDFKGPSLATCGKLNCANNILKNISVENPSILEEIQISEENPILSHEKHDSKELTAVGNKLGQGTNLELHLSPHYPIPPNFVWKERKYPSPRRVSAACDFPPGCGRNLTSLSQKNQVLAEDKDKKIMSESDGASSSNSELQKKSNGVIEIKRDVIVLSLMCAASCPWRQVKRSAKLSSSRKGKKNGYCAEDNRRPFSTKCEDNTEWLAEKSTTYLPKDIEKPLEFRDDERYSEVKKYVFTNDISDGKEKSPIYAVKTIDKKNLYPPGCGRNLTSLSQQNQVLVEDKDKKIKSESDGASSSNSELLKKSNGVIEIERGVIVLSLMCAVSCPWRQVKRSAKLSSSRKAKNSGYCAEDNRRPFPTKCEDNTERLAEKSTTYLPKDIEKPLAFRDDERYSEVKKYVVANDISDGKEKLPIYAVNTIDDEKPPPFTYITSIIYPDWCRPLPLQGCNCKNGCFDPNHCSCAIKNGGEIPYNLSGAILQRKKIVYECGPFCKCPPSCYNKVSQIGIKLPLEIFKTKYMGWGVRCRSFVASGSFICEYTGELLDDTEAEQRVGSDEYLFDIGKNCSDGIPEIASGVVENGFTIDAANYGNVGRFVNHSCSPNLYAQDVLYDHEDTRIPHVMLFASEDIPPLQELTYDYHYTIDQVFDSKGNIKRKNCYCGSAECTGRMY